MKKLRSWTPVLGLIALTALFFKLPEISSLFGCRVCSLERPYFPLLGSGYFALLIAAPLLFPTFPGPKMARAGLVWAVVLAAALIYLQLPSWCFLCLIAHVCHISKWAILTMTTPVSKASTQPFLQRIYLLILAPLAIIALFGSLNLTVMAYGFKPKSKPAAALHIGDKAPSFTAQTLKGELFNSVQAETVVINFISPSCPFCREQLPIVNSVAAQRSYKFINISPTLPSDLVDIAPAAEWIEDKDEKLNTLFKVSGYPTLFVVGKEGTITQVVAGVPEKLQALLLNLPK